MRQRRRAFALIIALGLGSPSLNLSASAQPLISAAAISISAESEIASALYSASATQEAIQRSADARIRSLRMEIDGLRTEANRLKAAGEAQTRAVDSARLELTRAEERFVAELALLDRAYAAEIAVFRSAVTDIASTQEGLEALAFYNAGDEIGAIAILDDLRAARAAARQVRIDAESAAEARTVAALALDALSRGKLTTLDVIARYEEITALDPDDYEDWFELSKLYQSAGKPDLSEQAAHRARELLLDDRDRSVAIIQVGDALLAQRDYAGALRNYQESLEIRNRLDAEDPGNAVYMRDLSSALVKVGDVLRLQGDLSGARRAFEDSYVLTKELSDTDPYWLPSHAISIERVADVLLAEGKGEEALEKFRDVLSLMSKRAEENPEDVRRQHDVSVALNKVGDALASLGKNEAASDAFNDSLAIAERLASLDPKNVIWQRGRISSLVKLAESEASKTYYADALGIAEQMQREGILYTSDEWILVELKRLAGKP